MIFPSKRCTTSGGRASPHIKSAMKAEPQAPKSKFPITRRRRTCPIFFSETIIPILPTFMLNVKLFSFLPTLRLPKTSFQNNNIIRQPINYPSSLHSPVRRAFIPMKKRRRFHPLAITPVILTKPNIRHETAIAGTFKKASGRKPSD